VCCAQAVEHGQAAHAAKAQVEDHAARLAHVDGIQERFSRFECLHGQALREQQQ
jgi:hypothetical protein